MLLQRVVGGLGCFLKTSRREKRLVISSFILFKVVLSSKVVCHLGGKREEKKSGEKSSGRVPLLAQAFADKGQDKDARLVAFALFFSRIPSL